MHVFTSWIQIGTLVSTLFFASCNGLAIFPVRDLRIENKKFDSEYKEVDGVTSAKVAADSKTEQTIAAGEGSDLAGTSVTFPVGSLAVGTEVSIQPGVSVATAPNLSELGVKSKVNGTGPSVSVAAKDAQDTLVPMTISIPLPSGSALQLEDSYELLVVIYMIKSNVDQTVKVGIIPRKDLTVAETKVNLTSTFFGLYQAVYLSIPVKEAVVTNLDSSRTNILTKKAAQELPAIAITGRMPLIVSAGDRVELTGSNFRSSVRLALGYTKVSDIEVKSDTRLAFVVPSSDAVGLNSLTADQDGVEANASIVYSPDSAKYPIIGELPAEVCSGKKYYNLNGELAEGTKNCSGTTLADCSSDGQTNCRAVSAFKAVDMANAVAANIKSGVTLAGIAGSYSGSNAACSFDGETGCLTTASYKAADMSQVVAANVRSGVTIAGIAGTYPSLSTPLAGASGTSDLVSMAASTAAGSFEFWDSAGVRYTGTITDAGTITPTTSNQSFNTSLYRQFTVNGDANLVAAKIKNGVSLFGVTGDYPSATSPLASNTATVDLDSATFNAKMKSASSFEWFDSTGVAYTNTGDADIAAANILSGIDLFGVMGSVTPESHANCSGNAQVGCVTTATYKSADLTNVTQANIKNGVTIAGIPGLYPSATYPLTGASGTADLDTATFNAKVKSSAPFEYWDSAGNRWTGAGDSNIAPGNYIAGVSIFGVFGSIANCSTDGGFNCMATGSFPSANIAAISNYDIRAGKTLGGISGLIKFCRNSANNTIFNNATAPAISGLDWFDSIDDYNNNLTGLPGNNPGTANDVCSTAEWQDVTSGGCISSGAECMYKDRVTNLVWAEVPASTQTWTSALSYCDNLTFGSRTDWRTPTHKEMMHAVVDGIRSIESTNFGDVDQSFWTATSRSDATTMGFIIDLGSGMSSAVTKTSSYKTMCVAP